MGDYSKLQDEELFSLIESLVEEERRRLQDFLAVLSVIDRRGAARSRGYHSTFDYCVRKLALSEDEAYKRIAAARAVNIRPEILSAISDGGMTLTGVARLAPYLRRPDAPELIARSIGKTMRQIEEILAPFAPEPPRRDFVREIVVATPYQEEARVEFWFQGSRELRFALERVTQLMSHKHPSGALELIILEMASEYLERHDPLSGGGVGRAPAVKGSSTIPASVRREVWRRDGGRCVFAYAGGQRCDARTLLELDHILPRSLGGRDTIDNLRLLCRPHNDAERRRILGEGKAATSGLLSDPANRGSP